MTTTRTLTIQAIDRLPNSRNGNPRFRFTFTDGTSANLQSDASYGYEVGNPGHREGDTLDFHFSGRGTVKFARPVEITPALTAFDAAGEYAAAHPEIVRGIAWPMASDGDDSLPWVERDDDADAFDDDIEAAEALATRLGGDARVMFAVVHDAPGTLTGGRASDWAAHLQPFILAPSR